MVSGATSRISLLSPRKSCMAVSTAPSASTLNASANWLDWVPLLVLSTLGWSLANRHLLSAVVVAKLTPRKLVEVPPVMAVPNRAAPNRSRVR